MSHPTTASLAESLVLERPIVMVGLMGCGKTAIGTRVAKAMGIPFIDVDKAIEGKVGCSISDIFAYNGEAYFRKIEQETIRELMAQSAAQVIATGGGAFVNDETRALIKEKATAVWLDAPFEVLLERVSRKKTRPLLEQGDKAQILRELMEKRTPFYAEAPIRVESGNCQHDEMVRRVITAVKKYQQG